MADVKAEPVAHPPVVFTSAGLRRGAVAAQALGVSAFLYGIAFGLMARQAGLSMGEATLTSAFVYSGTAQLAAITAIASGQAAPVAMATTILVMNARYILFGAALHAWLSRIPTARACLGLFFLGDANWMMSMKAYADGERDAAYVLGSGLPMFTGWLAGTVFGNMGAGILPDPRLLGFDFMLAAFAAAMMAGMAKTRADLGPILAGGGAAVAASAVTSFGWAVVAAGVAGAATAALRPGRERSR